MVHGSALGIYRMVDAWKIPLLNTGGSGLVAVAATAGAAGALATSFYALNKQTRAEEE